MRRETEAEGRKGKMVELEKVKERVKTGEGEGGHRGTEDEGEGG